MSLEVGAAQYTGNAGANRSISLGLSGTPQLAFTIERSGANPMMLKNHTTADECFYSGSTVLESDGIRTLASGGITIGANGDVNASGVGYTAVGFFSDDDSEFAVGSYAGAGGTGQTVTTGFQPTFVWIWADNDFNNGRVWFSSEGGDNSKNFFGGSGVSASGWVTGVTSTAFTTGSNLDTSGRTYYWAAWQAVSGGTDVGTYSGDSTNNRDITFATITSVPAKQRIIFVKGDAGVAQRGVQAPSTDEPSSHSVFGGSSNLYVSKSTAASTFEVNNQQPVNVSGTTYYYFAAQDSGAASTSTAAALSDAPGASLSAPFAFPSSAYSFFKAGLQLEDILKKVRII